MTFNRGSKGPGASSYKDKESQNVVFNRSGAYSHTSPSKVIPVGGKQPGAQDQQEQAEVHVMSKSLGRPPQMGSANDLPVHTRTSPSMEVGREEQQG